MVLVIRISKVNLFFNVFCTLLYCLEIFSLIRIIFNQLYLTLTTDGTNTLSQSVYYRINVLCYKERSPQKKKYSNSKVREENIAVVYYSAMITATLKVHVSYVLLLPSSGGDGGVGESWLLTHACHSILGRTGRGLGTFDSPVLKAAFNSAKISLLVFLYGDIGEQIEDPAMFDVTSETRDDSCVIILKSRLTLQVRASLVTPSLIDDSVRL